ncbi:MAG: hypothetical protein ABW168_07010, partial [Sedimenticola sp.]
GPYKKRVKNNHGRLMPFESIDTSLYEKKAFCTCFLTSEERIYIWTYVLAQKLYVQLGNSDNYIVNWSDFPLTGTPAQTEFIVRTTKSPDDDDLLYKVIIYFTTGKVMIQGKDFTRWCFDQFDLTKQEVDNHMGVVSMKMGAIVKDVDTTELKTILTEEKLQLPLVNTADIDGDPTIIHHVDSCVQTESSAKRATPTGNLPTLDEHDEIPIDIFVTQIETLNKRLSHFESSLVNISDGLLKAHEAISTIGTSVKSSVETSIKATIQRVLSEKMKEITNTLKPTSLSSDIGKDSVIESQNETISSLKKSVTEAEMTKQLQYEAKISNLTQTYEKTISGLNSRIEVLVRDRHTADSQAEKQADDILKLELEINVNKDTIHSLTDRLEHIRLDYEGGTWNQAGSQRAKSPTRLTTSTTGATSRPISTPINNQSAENIAYTDGHGNLTTECGLAQDTRTPNRFSALENDSVQQSESVEFRGNSESPAVYRESRKRPHNSTYDEETHEVIFFHDSIHKHIKYEELSKLNKESNIRIRPEHTLYADGLQEKINSTNFQKVKTIITHVGTNDIKQGANINSTTDCYSQAVTTATDKGARVVISLLTPTRDENLNSDISLFNENMKRKFVDNNLVTICDNKNISVPMTFKIRESDCEKDGIHINKFIGTRKLAANLKYALSSSLHINRPQRDPRPRSRSAAAYNRQRQPRSGGGPSLDIDEMTSIVTAAIRAVQQSRGGT